MALQYLSPMIVNRIASSLGINSTIAQTAINAILPTILAGIVGKAAQPGGGQALSDILGRQDTSVLGKLGDIIGGSNQKSFTDQGTSVLGSLLGGNAIGALAGAASKFTGMGAAPTSGLIGMLAPVVLGSLAGQQKSSGLDAGGLVNLLMGQKDNIASAIPGDFAKLLGGSGLIDSIGPNLAKAAGAATVGAVAAKVQDTVSGAARSAHDTVTSAARTAQASVPAAPSFNWMPWVLGAVAALAAWWFLMPSSKPTVVALPKAPAILAPGNVDLGGQLGTTLTGLTRSLGSITDVASARTALGGLTQAQSDVARIGGLAAQLPADGKKSLASYVSAALPLVRPIADKLLKDSAIGPIVKAPLDGILGGLDRMSK
jgi:hypothetical protein